MILQSLALTEGKKMRYTRTMLVAVAATVWCAQVSVRAEPIGTAFTYQGQLKQAGVPVDGQANLLFGLYDAETDGTLIDDFVAPLVEVVDGLFTVQLDFDAGVFDGSALWLEVVVEHPPRRTELDNAKPPTTDHTDPLRVVCREWTRWRWRTLGCERWGHL